MKRIKKFTQSINENMDDKYSKPQPRVKHLIEYLSKLDPEMEVHLDKNGWSMDGNTPSEVVENDSLFWVWTNTEGKSILTINN